MVLPLSPPTRGLYLPEIARQAGWWDCMRAARSGLKDSVIRVRF